MSENDYPEAMLNVFITIMKKTPSGGATMDDLKEAYSEVRGSIPTARTIQRIIRRLTELFDPLAYVKTPEDSELESELNLNDNELAEPQMGITYVKRGPERKRHYRFRGSFTTPSIDLNNALFTALNLYPQNPNMLKEAFRTAMHRLVADAMKGLSSYIRLVSDIDAHVYVAEPVAADTPKHAKLIDDIFRAIREKKSVRIKYLRTYDGTLTERIVDPYGLICRFSNWYLTGFCRERKERRVFHLAHIQGLRVLDTSTFEIPSGFSLSGEYSKMWAIRTGDDEPAKAEKVRLLISKGVAERFKNLRFHNSQEVKKLENGEVEVTYDLSYADEMIPWIVSWGNTVKILEPKWLHDKTIKALNETLAHHSGK